MIRSPSEHLSGIQITDDSLQRVSQSKIGWHTGLTQNNIESIACHATEVETSRMNWLGHAGVQSFVGSKIIEPESLGKPVGPASFRDLLPGTKL